MNEHVCATCGELNPERAVVCGMCRTPLNADPESGDQGRLVTVVTSDLKGSTALGERLDPESLREVLNRYFAVMRVVFESHGGTIEKIIGDAIVAVFGLPFRRDDDAIRAVEAATESQRALATLNDELEQLWGVRLVNRTGVATGIVHFGRDNAGQHVLIGDTMDESTAMEQNAPPLEVLLAESALEATRDVVEVADEGLKSPKGSDREIRAYRLVSVHARSAEADGPTPEPSAGMRLCATCGEESPDRYRYCLTCGTAFTTETVSRENRRTVTIVFANPKPETLSGEAIAPDAFTDVMGRYFESMKAALERHGGTVEKFIGDAVMAVFGLPVRHEDDALRAVRAAADMQRALPDLNAAFEAEHGVRLLNHIGVNTGEVIAAGDASSGQRLVTGDTVNTAARLEQAAGPAEIILGELTHRLTRDTIEVEVIAPLTLKGKAEPVPAYRFMGVRAKPVEPAGAATPFVGREVEMGRLAAALFDAAQERRPRLLTVIGDAGVGKSRLIREFAASTSHEASLIRGRCLPYGDGITFWALAEAFRDAASIAADDSTETATAKLRALIPGDAWDEDRSAIVERVAALMGLSTTAFPVAELTWGARRLLEVLAHERPLILIVDDIHSAEPTLLDLFDHVLEVAADAPVLLICTARHELLERRAEWGEAHADQTITLTPLTETETNQIVAGLLGDLDPDVRERIATAADGNPLYTEQIVSMLQETGAIRRDGDRWVSAKASASIAIPPTVQALVAARLDALASEERAVIEPASVIGMSFAEEAITELVEEVIRPSLRNDIDGLVSKQLVRPAGGEEPMWRFGHLVIRDTTYGSLLKRIRAALHERFVVWAERVNKERGRETEFEEILGYHLESAYRYRTELGVIDDEAREVGRRAATKLASAGQRALARADLPAAENLLRRATDVLERDAPRRLELLVDLGEAHAQQGQFDAAMQVLDETVAIADETDERRVAVRANVVRVTVDMFRGGDGSAARAIEAANQAIATLEPLGDSAGLARAWRLIMSVHIGQGQLEQAAAAAERIIECAGDAGDARLAARASGSIAYVLLHGPTPADEAAATCAELLERMAGDRAAVAVVESIQAILLAMQGRSEEARALYKRAYGTLTEVGSGIVTLTSSIDSSQVERLNGDLATAEAELRRDFEALTAIDESFFRSTVAAFLSQVLWASGQVDDAQYFTEIAETLGEDDDVLTQVPWRGVRAKILAGNGERARALALVTEAVELADATTDPRLRAEARLDLADVIEAIGDESAGPPLREALRLFEQKGDVVSADRVRSRLGSLVA